MTPFQMAVAECPNYGVSGCDNIIITNKLHLVRRDPLQKCLLSLGKRCEYFETTVLPTTSKDENYAEGLKDAEDEYLQSFPAFRMTKKGSKSGAASIKRPRGNVVHPMFAFNREAR